MDHLEDRLDLTLRQALPLMQSGIIRATTYFGVRTFKCPLDAWVYQQMLFELRPSTIVEIGNANGGSALMLAHLCDLLGGGRILAVDLSHRNVPRHVRDHPRIDWIEGDACDVYPRVRSEVGPDERVLVIDDSAHTYDHTLRVLQTYCELLQPGDYFVVEDSIAGHGLPTNRTRGPYEAIAEFLRTHQGYEADRSKEQYFLTCNPSGFLRRVPAARSERDGSRAASRRPLTVRESRVRESIRMLLPPIVVLAIQKLNDRFLIRETPSDA